MAIYRIKLGKFLHMMKCEGTGWQILTFNTTWSLNMDTYNTAVLLAFVRGGHDSQILDDLLGVLCLPSTRLPTREGKIRRGLKDARGEIVKGNEGERDNKKIISTDTSSVHSSITQFN